MPGPIFGARQQPGLATGSPPRTTARSAGRTTLLSTPRSARYLAAFDRLDAATSVTPVELAEIIDALHEEFASRWASTPLGYVGHCYLGAPFEAHTLTTDGQIIEHYRGGQPLPGSLERARPLARTVHYRVVEVYSDQLVCVRFDGSVVEMEG